MTGPYQPPGGDVNSPFGPPDPNSPFTPAAGSQGESPKDEDESSPYQGVQYELETPGQPPVTPPPPTSPPAYRPAPPPPAPSYGPQPTYMPPPKKSGNGLLIGGVIAGVVVLFFLAAIVFVAVAASSSGGDGGQTDQAEYDLISSPCTDVDLSPITAISSFSTEPTPDSNDYGTYGSASCVSGVLGDSTTSSYGYFNMYVYTYDSVEGAESMYKTDTGDSGLTGCSTSEVSGSWAKGTLGTGSSSSCAYGYAGGTMTALVIQDGNLEAKFMLDATNDLAGSAEDALKSVAESLLTASKA